MNRSLFAGLALLLGLAAAAVLDDSIALFESGEQETFRKVVENGVTGYRYPPEPPMGAHPFGTDIYGFDIFSEMAHGLRWTLGIVLSTTLTGCFLGAVIGTIRGASGSRQSRGDVPDRGVPGSLKRGFSPLSGFPSFLFAAFLYYPVTVNSSLPPGVLFAYQAAVLILVTLPPVISGFTMRAHKLSKMPFMDAALSEGANLPWLLKKHYLPFILTDFVEALPVQALTIASIIGKLGFISLFIGGTLLTYEPRILHSIQGEWLGLVGYYYVSVFGRPWLFWAPFGGWLLVFADLSLLSSGLRKAFGKLKKISAMG